jgi:hypothetical protein
VEGGGAPVLLLLDASAGEAVVAKDLFVGMVLRWPIRRSISVV